MHTITDTIFFRLGWPVFEVVAERRMFVRHGQCCTHSSNTSLQGKKRRWLISCDLNTEFMRVAHIFYNSYLTTFLIPFITHTKIRGFRNAFVAIVRAESLDLTSVFAQCFPVGVRILNIFTPLGFQMFTK
jgi:hypothetical protein